MDATTFRGNAHKQVAQRNIFLFFSVALSVSLVLLTVLFFSKSERTVIVPTSGPAFWVEEKRVSAGYLERMGFYLSDILLNRTPADVERKNQLILEHVHPAFYHEVRKQLLQEKESILANGQSFYFRQEKGAGDLSKGAFQVEGDFFVFIGKEGELPSCAKQERKKYTLVFQCENGKLLLTSLKKEQA